MTAERLFLATLEDLDNRLELGRGEYDALCMAWLLRRLFHNGSRSLVAQANAEPAVELVFTVRDDHSVEGLAGWIPIAPTDDGRTTIDLGLEAFLKRTAIVIWPENDHSKRVEISVSKLIRWQANNEGAVHLSRSTEPWELALEEYRDGFSLRTAHGVYTMGVFALAGIGQVARAGLEPLRVRVRSGLLLDDAVRDSTG
jgi:hypothetical protein